MEHSFYSVEGSSSVHATAEKSVQ